MQHFAIDDLTRQFFVFEGPILTICFSLWDRRPPMGSGGGVWDRLAAVFKKIVFYVFLEILTSIP